MKSEWIKQPIPILDETASTRDYGSLPINVNDPRNAEPLIDVKNFGITAESYYARTDGNNKPYCRPIKGALSSLYCRQSICQHLSNVNKLLAPEGLELFMWDAYRTIACQQSIFSFFKQKVATDHPNLTSGECYNDITYYVSDPNDFDMDNSKTWPVHTTGAAVDLTIRDRSSSRCLDMGTHFDDMQPVSHSDFFERELASGRISKEDPRLLNRRLLHAVMKTGGFINYPCEFWHFDWGNQMYVQNLHYHHAEVPEAAWYGYIEPPLEH